MKVAIGALLVALGAGATVAVVYSWREPSAQLGEPVLVKVCASGHTIHRMPDGSFLASWHHRPSASAMRVNGPEVCR